MQQVDVELKDLKLKLSYFYLMKHNLLFSLLFVVLPYLGMAQFEPGDAPPADTEKKESKNYDWHPEIEFQTPDLAVFGAFGYQHYNRYDQNIFVGVALEYGFAKHWSANYTVQAGPDYAHFPLFTPIASVIWLFSRPNRGRYFTEDWAKYLFLLPEGVSYTFEPIPGFGFKPYLNPFGVTILGTVDDQNIKEYLGYVMLSAGGQVQLTALRKWSISAYADYRLSWDGTRRGVQTGVTVSYNFGLRRRYPFWFNQSRVY